MMLKKIFLTFLFFLFFVGIACAAVAAWGYYYITRDLPTLTSINDYKPSVVTNVFSEEGKLVGEFYRERRYPVKFNEIPAVVRNAFVAAEDASFYKHQGLDPISILRATFYNLQAGSAKQGGSTITQQVVKNLLLTPERKYKRKLKEAILAYQIEKRLSKDEIFEIYLNEIFFGNTAYGIRSAAKCYFGKELDQINLSEAALLAGLPKAPSRYSPISNLKAAKRRQRYVLNQMAEAGFISKEEAETAFKEHVEVRRATSQNIYEAPYYVSEVRRVFQERWPEYDLEGDGLTIYTALNIDANRFATDALRKHLKKIDKQRGWRGPIGLIPDLNKQIFERDFVQFSDKNIIPGEIYPALVTDITKSKSQIKIDLGFLESTVDVSKASWAKRYRDKEGNVISAQVIDKIKEGNVVEVSIVESDKKDNDKEKDNEKGEVSFVLDQTPEIEGAVVLIEPGTGKVATIIGGYSYQRSVFNRATMSRRQPGSAFKPIIYLAAIDGFQYTPSTIVHDNPRTFKVGDEYWTPGNFDEKFLGGITLRTALEKSRNLVSVDIVSRIGLTPIVKYARLLGIESPMGRNLSISLGSSEVTPLELTRAYGVFASRGILYDSVMITKIVDRAGNVIFDSDTQRLNRARQVIPETSAFIMAHLMKGVVEYGTGTAAKAVGRPTAGKTGTTNECMDTWFIGYTPDWAAGVWIGFDQKKSIGEKETGGKIAAPLWADFMKPFLDNQDSKKGERLIKDSQEEAQKLGIEYVAPEPIEPLDFSPPQGVDPYWVNKSSGLVAPDGEQGAIIEYFVSGTEPPKGGNGQEDVSSYLESPEL